MGKCNCPPGVHIQGYENTVQLQAPSWSSHETITVDRCIAEEIQALWDHGIQTCGSCCGHHIAIPMINPCRHEDAVSMAGLGYLVVINQNGAYVARPKSIDSYDWTP